MLHEVLNRSPKLAPYLVDTGVLRAEPVLLVDVGASGGIGEEWRRFGDCLQAVAFDPLVREMERLRAAEQNPAVQYVSGLVGHGKAEPWTFGFSTDPHQRTSSLRAWELLKCNYTNTYFDQTHEGTLAENRIDLDEYFAERAAEVDCIKVDTDGQDFEVLRGAQRLISGAGPVAIAVESNLVGSASPRANVFSNIERYLQPLGYSLFALEPKRHTRTALPGLFRWNQPADTHKGQTRWAEALFCRDAATPGYEEHFGLTFSARKLLKLCCFFEMYSLEDCAAEVLLVFRERIAPLADVERCLDLLTPPLPDGRVVPYREYIDFFEKNVEAFYSGR